MTYQELWNKYRFQIESKYVREWSGGHLHDWTLRVGMTQVEIQTNWEDIDFDIVIALKMIGQDVRAYRRISTEAEYRIVYPNAQRSWSDFQTFYVNLRKQLGDPFLDDLSYVQ